MCDVLCNFCINKVPLEWEGMRAGRFISNDGYLHSNVCVFPRVTGWNAKMLELRGRIFGEAIKS